jgi:hypothetical protein
MRPLDAGFSSRTHYCVGVIVLVALGTGALMAVRYMFW